MVLLTFIPAAYYGVFGEGQNTIKPGRHRIPALFEESNPSDLRMT